MKVINAFPLEGKGVHHGLSKFKKWIDGFDPLLDQVSVEKHARAATNPSVFFFCPIYLWTAFWHSFFFFHFVLDGTTPRSLSASRFFFWSAIQNNVSISAGHGIDILPCRRSSSPLSLHGQWLIWSVLLTIYTYFAISSYTGPSPTPPAIVSRVSWRFRCFYRIDIFRVMDRVRVTASS